MAAASLADRQLEMLRAMAALDFADFETWGEAAPGVRSTSSPSTAT